MLQDAMANICILLQVIHGFVRCITPGKRPPVSLSFAEALLAPRIEAHDKFPQPWKPGRMHQVIWARGVLEAYARLHGMRSLLTELLSIDQVLSEVNGAPDSLACDSPQ